MDLPLSAAVVLSSQVIAGRLLPQLPPRLMIVPGLLVAATAMHCSPTPIRTNEGAAAMTGTTDEQVREPSQAT